MTEQLDQNRLNPGLFFNNHKLLDSEVKLMKLLATSDTNDVIAEKLLMPMGSFNKFKRDLYRKLNVQTKQEAVVITVKLNLI